SRCCPVRLPGRDHDRSRAAVGDCYRLAAHVARSEAVPKVPDSILEQGLIVPCNDGTFEYGCAQDSGRIESIVGSPRPTLNGGIEIDWVTTSHGNDDRLVRMGRTWQGEKNRLSYQAFLTTVRSGDYRQHLDAVLMRVGWPQVCCTSAHHPRSHPEYLWRVKGAFDHSCTERHAISAMPRRQRRDRPLSASVTRDARRTPRPTRSRVRYSELLD